MSALAKLQARFFTGLLHPGDAPHADIWSSASFSADQRLAVYANAYRQRLIEAVGSVYERSRVVLGEEVFDSCALTYVESHAPTTRELRWYGNDFPEWLRTQPDSPAFASDLAIVDRGLRRAFDAADSAAVSRNDLLAITPSQWTQLRLDWHPALSIDFADPRALAIWRREADSLDASQTPPQVMVAFWRSECLTYFRSLPTAEALLLQRMRSGSTFAEACLDPTSPIEPDSAATALLTWVDDGWIASIRLDGPCETANDCEAITPPQSHQQDAVR